MDESISKKAVIEAIKKCHKMCCRKDACGDEWIHYETVLNEVECIPPAEPKRGRWHYSDGKPARIGLSFGVVCDQCGTESEYCTNFCGECGADMREVTE